MENRTPNGKPSTSITPWKNQTYLMGLVFGVIFGLTAAYFFTRAAQEDADKNGGKPQPIQTGQLISLGLAALGLVRQIADLGKSPKKR